MIKRILLLAATLWCVVLVGKEHTQRLKKQQAEPATIVLVHGFMRSKLNMAAFRHTFKKEGYSVVNWCYPSKKYKIEDHADELVYKLQALAKEHPGKPISFVTHSMGGLIVRCALNHPQCPKEATMGRAVLVAPPNRGSICARKLHQIPPVRWLLGKYAGMQLMTTEKDGFDALGTFPKNMPVLVIAGSCGLNSWLGGSNDGKVLIKETHLTTDHYHLTHCSGHSWICYSPEVVRQTKHFLLSPTLKGTDYKHYP